MLYCFGDEVGAFCAIFVQIFLQNGDNFVQIKSLSVKFLHKCLLYQNGLFDRLISAGPLLKRIFDDFKLENVHIDYLLSLLRFTGIFMKVYKPHIGPADILKVGGKG